MRKLKYLLEFIPVAVLDRIFLLMPRRLAVRAGERVGTLMSFVLGKRRALVLENLRRAFPEKRENELEEIARGVWRNVGRTAAEFIRMSDINEKNFEEYFSYENVEALRSAVRLGKGVIILSPHLGNWEGAGIATGYAAEGLIAVARPVKNPFVDAWVLKKRSVAKMEITIHRDAVKAGLRALKKGRPFGLLVDQNLYTGGVFINFFGRPAATTPLPALLHERTGAPVIFVFCLHDGDRFRVVYSDPLVFPDVPDTDARMRAHTQVVADAMEAVIRRHPEQWFWLHNRWKRSAEAPAGVAP